MTRKIPIDNAVGMVLPHDITEIRPHHRGPTEEQDAFKGPAFRKGHIICSADIPHLKRLGKEHVYVLDLGPDEIHENEAAALMAKALAGGGTEISGQAVEGKINMVAAHDGLVKINTEMLFAFNMLGEVMCATLHNNTPVNKGDQVAATRLIPLVAQIKVVEEAVEIATKTDGIIKVLPLNSVKAGLVITGREVYEGRVDDGFEPLLREKLARFGSALHIVRMAPDDAEVIAEQITFCRDQGVDLIITSGGMSVDPDDVTREGITLAGAHDIVYGTPVLPGAMFLVGYCGQIPVVGLPACGMFHKITIFDLILPRLLAGEKISRQDIAALGHGGLCRNCATCKYPICGFGK